MADSNREVLSAFTTGDEFMRTVRQVQDSELATAGAVGNPNGEGAFGHNEDDAIITPEMEARLAAFLESSSDSIESGGPGHGNDGITDGAGGDQSSDNGIITGANGDQSSNGVVNDGSSQGKTDIIGNNGNNVIITGGDDASGAVGGNVETGSGIIEPGDGTGGIIEPGDGTGGIIEPGDGTGGIIEPGVSTGGSIETTEG